ncbi:CRP-like cAMP-binding protein [Parabacteroides sp. PFB2-10]|uniref:Crp/Fnr family transcriptional regulator n=1 Tax=Parabacteroides sp. PFB2-10 TaxID=1742405 RepID=UPI0024757526|nr:Crp/Fnr family transcriptional regulator [Parabacteroides sp. PFB2-10]MDH6312032.1 CRP-like cAMP-binding protein [Parabacteroides sp. PFB2-10]MDL2208329.1 Crp/Fnr family transcriptional regulator [Parabacteroides sp. OttesenSCG-928-O15]MDL2244180.1 Crp/Fnr family transcriptional regulator [Parabacteroides sp. OttesenSCG-928-J18]
MIDVHILSRISLFHSVPTDELERIFSLIPIDEVSFKKNEVIARQDEPVNRLIILLSGSVTAEMSDPAGRVVKVEDIEAPNPLAILFLFGDNNRFPVQATAREETRALIIPRQAILKMLQMNETMLRNYLDISANFAGRLSRKLHLMSFRTIRQKIALYLFQLAKEQGSDQILLDRSKSALADLFGVSRPSLERELTKMQTDGLILSEKRVITIKKREKLVQLIHF